jgi:hypothetical protein
MDVSDQLHTLATLPLEKEYPVPTVKEAGGPQSWCECGGEEIKYQPLPGIKPQSYNP